MPSALFVLPTSPTISSDNIIFVGGYSTFSAIDGVTGESKWQFFNENSLGFSPAAIGVDGTVYTYSWSVDGVSTQQLESTIGNGINCEIKDTILSVYSSWGLSLNSLFAMCDVYNAISSNGLRIEVYAFNASTGFLKWTLNSTSSCATSSFPLVQRLGPPALGEDGTIFISMQDVYAISPGGQLLWYTHLAGCQDEWFTSPAWALPSLAIDADGTLYVSDIHFHVISVC